MLININMLIMLLQTIHQKIESLEIMYKNPTDINFRKLNFNNITWDSNKEKNFFQIIKALILRGPLSLNALTTMYIDDEHSFKSTQQIFHRLLNGSKNGVISLQQKGLIIKDGRLFKLSPLGILYAIHTFHHDKYYIIEKEFFANAKISNITTDFSYQKKALGILDILKKHCNYFPMIFDNLDYIKSHTNLDLNVIFNVISYNSTLNLSLCNFYDFNPVDDSLDLDKFIPFVFYLANINKCGKNRVKIELHPEIESFMIEMYKPMIKNMIFDCGYFNNVFNMNFIDNFNETMESVMT